MREKEEAEPSENMGKDGATWVEEMGEEVSEISHLEEKLSHSVIVVDSWNLLRLEGISNGTKALEGLAVGKAAVEEGRAVEWLSGENTVAATAFEDIDLADILELKFSKILILDWMKDKY